MGELKTKQHDGDVFEFINSFANTEQKRKDSYELVEVYAKGYRISTQNVGSFHYWLWQLSL
jgi:hypothetical protein